MTSSTAPDVSVQEITPEMATQWLEKNRNLRPVSAPYVDMWANQIKEGKWELVPDAIGFDADGFLVEGQHRLMAVVKAGKPARFIVVRGLTKESVLVTDSGRPRRPADFLRAMVPGAKNYTGVVAVAKAMMSRPGEASRLLPKHEPAQYAVQYLKLIESFMDIHEHFGAGVAAAFCLGVQYGDSGRKPERMETLRKCADRLISMDWTSPTDVMKVLFRKLNAQDARGHTDERYLLTVTALRAALGRKKLERLRAAEEDWKGRPETEEKAAEVESAVESK